MVLLTQDSRQQPGPSPVDFAPREDGHPGKGTGEGLMASDQGVRLTSSESGRLLVLEDIIHPKIRILYFWTQNNERKL